MSRLNKQVFFCVNLVATCHHRTKSLEELKKRERQSAAKELLKKDGPDYRAACNDLYSILHSDNDLSSAQALAVLGVGLRFMVCSEELALCIPMEQEV